ncbi:MAG TPA: DMT family transporter [Bacteroidia bacterium]|nr:DMT family transporter [Bacteroidia bacterium]
MTPGRRNYFLLHFIVFIWGWTAILGKQITLPAIKLVWLRIPIALGGILAYLLIARKPVAEKPSNLVKYFGVGLIVALHWICFYASIKESNVSITLACFSTGSLFTSFIEPVFFKRKISLYEIIFGLMVVIALLIIFGVETHFSIGIVLGVLAALTSSFFGVVNGYMVKKGHDGTLISLYEMAGGFAGMTVYVLLFHPFPGPLLAMSGEDLFYMLLLGLVCTSLPFLISLYILKTISPYTVSLTLNLETVYGIIFAYFIFHEDKQLTPWFYLGAAIILSTVFLNGWIKMRKPGNAAS